MLRRRNRLRSRAEDLGRQHVEKGRLVQRLAGVGAEQVVGPRDQVVEVGHDRALHVRDGPLVGEQERVEWIAAPARHLGHRVRVMLVDEGQQVGDLLAEDLGRVRLPSGLGIQKRWGTGSGPCRVGSKM